MAESDKKRKRAEDEDQGGGREKSPPKPVLSYARWWPEAGYYGCSDDKKLVSNLPDYLAYECRIFGDSEEKLKNLEETQAKDLKQITLRADDLSYGLTDYKEKLEERGKEAKENFDKLVKGLGIALANNLEVLHLREFNVGCADPIFKTGHELRRSERLGDFDIFACLADLYESGEVKQPCKLKEIILESSRLSASGFDRFMRAAKPPLRCFRTFDALIHGRNFEEVVKAIKDSIPNREQLHEFATNSSVGGNNPVGLLADAFPSLEVLQIPNIFGKANLENELKKFKYLVKSDTAVDDLLLRVSFHLEKGLCSLFATTDRHYDSHRGEGFCHLDDLENSAECMHAWKVGLGVTVEDINEFWLECGGTLDDEDYDSDPEEDYCSSCEEEEEGGGGLCIKGDGGDEEEAEEEEELLG
uniref:Uncharacterized protein n=1 Tax=Paramoeba aestuarina TaxID=180227 RepID=A0A7S4L960_9EUKA|eukprot:CAMPEP_0201527760 /NCGR_PEP_ID=MMETSP0161_2-20130828/36226_1 /ASSEMBLY_ACC=CAM_ASM_000251 /TAXON_ID=180227 /ORGANISM="Neoparamoeba aestuarina, Strain SoJaBio B1-5/56/2" /LENGTH=415 /DNA_ID=CAMNT_0047928719 /DNA_START=72 /DNA_END=1319 /DNA_ORIENTATION=-